MKWLSCILVAILTFSSIGIFAQQAKQANEGYTFDLASIRLNNSEPGKWSIMQPPTSGRFDATGIPVVSLLEYIYAPQKIRRDEIDGLPDWGYSDQWNITARTGDDVLARENAASPNPDVKEVLRRNRLRLESLLATRFSMKTTFATETRSVLVLSSVNSSKLQRTSGGNSATFMSFGAIKGVSQSMDSLATVLSNALQEQVLNETHLDGAFDYKLTWQPETDASPSAQGDSIYSAIKDQLGLQLKTEKRPVQVLKIEHIERPSAN
jgi:uncharacterized protein (TIGR03435 family)